MHGLINDLGILQEHIDVFCDSQSAICLSKIKSIKLVLNILMFVFTLFEKLLVKGTFVY